MTKPKGDKFGGVPQLFPAEKGTGHLTPEVVNRSCDPPGAEYDDNAINCAQCGAYLEDWTKFVTCWLCGGTNFLGEQFR